MLVYQDVIAIGIFHHEARRASRCLVGLSEKLNALHFQFALQLADISELGQLICIAVPTWVEGQDVALEHALEQTDDSVVVLHDQPVFNLIPTPYGKAELFIERARQRDIFHREADRKVAKLHDDSPLT